jgi:hypothetical protein
MAVTMTIYPSWKDKLGEAANLASDVFKVILLGGAHAYDAAHDELADVTANQIASGNGYVQDSKTLTGVTWTSDGANNRFDADDVAWTAAGGAIAAAHAVIYDDTVAGDPLVASIDFGGTQTANDGAQFKLIWNAAGIFTLS